MTPTEFLQKRNIVAEDKTDLIIGFDNGTKESLIDLLEAYHQAKLKLLGIADVVKSFGCGWNFCDAVLDKKGVVKCGKCNRYE